MPESAALKAMPCWLLCVAARPCRKARPKSGLRQFPWTFVAAGDIGFQRGCGLSVGATAGPRPVSTRQMPSDFRALPS